MAVTIKNLSKDIIQKAPNKIELHLGGCVDVMKTIPDKSIHLICTDPPFCTTNVKGDMPVSFQALWNAYKRILRSDGCVVMFGNQPFTSRLILSNQEWYKQCLVWNKNKCGSPGLAKIRHMQVHEDIVIFAPGVATYNPQMGVGEPYARKTTNPEGYEGKANNHGYGLKPVSEFTNDGTRYPKSVLNISRDFSAQQQLHGHQKPLSLMEYLVKTFSNEGDTVLDNFAGSGTTGLACINTDRSFIGIEKEIDYHAIAQNRLGILC
jgi:site-specific DNA-methyltransferase (adenine-specific)